MPRLIFKCPHIKGGTSAATAHLENYVKYMATRSGAERVDPGRSGWPATSNQKKLVEQILQDFPLSRGIFEYEDYAAAPTCANASEFITRALEDNYDQIAKKDNYLKYIATRPRAQRVGSHGLFTGEEDQLVLARVAEAVAAHPGNVWLPIISLRREDAARLGYDRAEEWKALLSKYAMEMAAAMKIPWEDFRWYAAFHDEAHHPHVHMVCYSADPSKGFLTKQGIAQIKSGLAKEIFRQELTELYQKQTQSRDALNEDARWVMEQLIEQMRSGAGDNDRMVSLILQNLYREILTVADENGGRLKNRVVFFADELGTCPPIQSLELMFSASRSRGLMLVPIVQSITGQLQKNYGKEGSEIIVDNCQVNLYGGFAPASQTAVELSKALGSRTVMSGSISRGRNDPSQSLQMMERPLMTPDELKSMPKGSFIVAKTGVHPMKVKLRLFLDWGIRFGKPYEVPEKAQRSVAYADKQELEESIIRRNYGTVAEQPSQETTSAAGGMSQGIWLIKWDAEFFLIFGCPSKVNGCTDSLPRSLYADARLHRFRRHLLRCLCRHGDEDCPVRYRLSGLLAGHGSGAVRPGQAHPHDLYPLPGIQPAAGDQQHRRVYPLWRDAAGR